LEASGEALRRLFEEKELESARVHQDAERAREQAEKLRLDAEEAVAVLQNDLQGHRAVVSAHAEEMELAQRALVEIEGRHGEELDVQRAYAAEELRRTNEDLDGHRAVLVELREELTKNVVVRETVEGDLRRVEELSLEIDAELRRTQGALEGSDKERSKVKEELERTNHELGGERETQAFLREELSSRWKNFVRAVWPGRRKY
jgi:chromosome segregation ATPase